MTERDEMVEKLKTYMHGFPTRAVVIDRVRELGIKGWPRDPTCCLVARLMEKDLGLRLSVTRRQVWHDHDSLVRLTDPFVAVIDDFDAGGYPELVETS